MVEEYRWLDKFKTKLKHSNKMKPKLAPLYLYQFNYRPNKQTMDIFEQSIAYNEMIIPEVSGSIVHYGILDVKTRLRRPQSEHPYLDHLLYDLGFQNLGLITNNQALDRLHADYHAVILNDIQDYVLNYLPIMLHYSKDCFIDYFSYAQVTPLRCLALIDDNGNYVLAMPTNEIADETLPVVEATVMQIKNLLHNMPRDPQECYMLAKNPELENAYHEDICAYNMYDCSTYREYSRGFYGDWYNETKQILFKQDKLIKQYLENNIQVSADDEGRCVFQMKPSNAFWDQYLASFTTQATLTDRLFENENMADINFTEILLSLKLKFFGRQSLAWYKHNSKVVDETSKDANEVKPLNDIDGLRNAISSMQPGNDHKYYLTNDGLTTLSMNAKTDDLLEKRKIHL